jgi:hypothetical protein
MQKVARATIYIVAFLVGLAVIGVGDAGAQQLVYSFSDPVGDETGAVDVTDMVVISDLQGNYQIYLTADAAHPFVGKFRVNINLFNPDVDPQFSAFSSKCTKKCDGFGGDTDYDLPTPRTKLVITGHDPVLKHWDAGTRAVTSTFAGLGNPPGPIFFRSGVDSFPLTFGTNEDCVACDGTGVVIGQRSFARRGWVLPPP